MAEAHISGQLVGEKRPWRVSGSIPDPAGSP